MHMAARSKRPEEKVKESATSAAKTVEGECVLDFCLEPAPTIVDNARLTRFSQC